MGELYSIREIARQLVEDYRRRRMINPHVFFAETPAEILAAMDILKEPRFDGIDKEWLHELGIEG